MIKDKLLRRKEVCKIISIRDTKIREMIQKGLFVKEISVPGFHEKLFSENDVNNWIEQMKENSKKEERKTND